MKENRIENMSNKEKVLKENIPNDQMQCNIQPDKKNESDHEKQAKSNLSISYSKGNNHIEFTEAIQPNENCSVIIQQSSICDIISQGEDLQDILNQQSTPTAMKAKLTPNKKIHLIYTHTNNNAKSFRKKKDSKVTQSKREKLIGFKTLTSTNNPIKHRNKLPYPLLQTHNVAKEDSMLMESNLTNNNHHHQEDKRQKMSHSMIEKNKNDLSFMNTQIKKNLQDPKFNITYDRFAQKLREHNNKIEMMKRTLKEKEDKCLRKIPVINSNSKKAINDTFYSRLEKKKQETENKKKQLRIIMEIEEQKKINKDRFLPLKSKADKADVDTTIDKIMEWEKGRKERLEKQKKERLKNILKQNKEKPTINRRSVEIAQRRYIDEDDRTFNRLYNEGAKLKEKKKMLVELYTPSFKPKLNSTAYHSRKDLSFYDEVENPDFLTDNIREMYRDKIKSNRNRSLE